jgi:glycosyltransferase involved in cell wall biosynthesis
MRIVFMAWRDLAHPQSGGSEVVVDRLATGLQGRGHEVTLLAGDPVQQRAYNVVGTGGRISQYLRAPAAYVRHHRDADIVIDVENGIPFFSPFYRRGPLVCFVNHVHAEQWKMLFPSPIAELGELLELKLMPRVYRDRQFVALSPSTARELLDLGIDASRIETFTMGCDPATRSRPRSPTPNFLCLGRLVPHKRVELLLAAWPHVHARTGGRLIIAGEGPMRPELERTRVPGVEFVGYVTDEEKQRLLDEAWLLVHPAHHEGWGLVIMEAAAHGTPTLAYDVVGVRDSVRHGVSGILVDSVEEFTRRWIELASRPDELDSLSQGALLWSAEHSWDRSVKEFEELLRDVAGSRPALRRSTPRAERPTGIS